MSCEFFTRYGNSGVPGECHADAELVLTYGGGAADMRPRLCVCQVHALVIVTRCPELGGIEQRFTPIVSAA